MCDPRVDNQALPTKHLIGTLNMAGRLIDHTSFIPRVCVCENTQRVLDNESENSKQCSPVRERLRTPGLPKQNF